MTSQSASFLGTGWSFPPTFSPDTRGVLMVSADEDIRQSLIVLLSTIPGERVMVPQYGCDLMPQVFRILNTTQMSTLRDMVQQSIVMWEPRIGVDTIQVTQDASQAGLMRIEIDYVIRATNTRSNLVYPFYLLEANNPV